MNAARFFSSVIRIAVVLCLTVSVSIGLFAGQGQASDDKVIKIGILAPLTGGSSADGEEMVRGAKLAVEELNAAGGVVGYKFKVVVGDTKDQVPDAVVSAFKKITADESVKCMMTGYASPTNFEIELMAEIDMPYLISANSAQTLAIVGENPDKFPTVWSLTPSYDAYETELPRIVEKWAEAGKMTLNNRKVAVVTSDNPYSKTISDGLKETFPTYKWTVTVDEMVPFGEVHDWRAIISKIRKDPPDLIVNTDYQPANEATFVDQFMERPTNSLLFLQYGPSVPEFVELTADRSTGIIYNLLGGAIPTSPVMKETAAKFDKEYGVESGAYGHSLYWQVMLYAEALEKVGDPDKKLEIGKVLGETDKEISSGRIKFDHKTHLAIQGDDYVPITFYQIWEGKRYLVFPDKFANGEFKLPPWMKK